MNVAEETLLKRVLAQGCLSLAIYGCVAQHVEAAEEADVDVVMLTCSSISPCADPACPVVEISVLIVGTQGQKVTVKKHVYAAITEGDVGGE